MPSRSSALLAILLVFLTALVSVGSTTSAREHPVVPIPQRLAGADRFATAAAVSQAHFEPGVPAVYVATGADFPDALAAAPAAAAQGGPLLLTQADTLPPATAAEVQRLQPDRVVVVGDRGVVGDDVLDALSASAGGAPVERIAGPTRFETAVAVSEAAFEPGVQVAYVATGNSFPDALAGGAAAAAQGGPMLLTAAEALPGATAEELRRLDPEQIVMLGGTAAVSEAVAEQLGQISPTTRVAGPDRYATAAAVADHAFGDGALTVLVATGTSFPDALAGGAAAVHARGGPAPLLLSSDRCVPGVVGEQIDRLGASSLTVLGGTAAVAEGVANLRGCPPPGPALDFDFEGDAPDAGWDLEPGTWRVTAYGSGHALRGEGHGFAGLSSFTGSPSRLSFRVQLDRGRLHANLHEDEVDGAHVRYFLTLSHGSVGLQRWDQTGQVTLANALAGLDEGVAHDVDILIGGGSIDVYIDGLGVLGVDEPSLLPPGRVSFESLEDTISYIDDVHVATGPEPEPHPRVQRPALALPPGPDVGPFTGGVHAGDLTLAGDEELVLRDGVYVVEEGQVFVTERALLRIEAGAALVMDRGDSPFFHRGVFVSEQARLELDGGDLAPGGDALATIALSDEATALVRDTWAHFHHGGAWDRSHVVVERARLVADAGGAFAMGSEAIVEVRDSVIGHVGLHIDAPASLAGEGLEPGYIADFDLHRDLDVSGIGIDLTLENTVVVPDDLGEGPYERGWVLIVEEDVEVELADSTLRKVVILMPAGGPDVDIAGLRLEQPTDLQIGDVTLDDVTFTGQWGFFMHGDRDGVFTDCEGLWFFAHDTVDLTIVDSTMNEWDPRDFTGTITFVDSQWTITGEIIGNNDYEMFGTVEIDPELRAGSLSWADSTVTRHYPVEVVDAQGDPQAGVTVTAAQPGEPDVTTTTDADGLADLVLAFGDADWLTPWQVTTDAGHAPAEVDFITSTPLRLEPS